MAKKQNNKPENVEQLELIRYWWQNGRASLEKSCQVLIKLNINLSCDPAISLLGIYPEGMKTYVHTKSCMGIFITVLFIFVNNWKQSGDLPGGTVVKTPRSQCRGPGFDPWSGN